MLPYLAMSYLYKRANRLWPFLIRHRLTAAVWRPLIQTLIPSTNRMAGILDERQTARSAEFCKFFDPT